MIQNSLIKIMMKWMEVIPKFDLTNPRSESINHPFFLDSDSLGRDKILSSMAMNHYLVHQKKPFSINFPNYNLYRLLKNKDVLDLGCWCGGMSVFCAEEWGVRSMSGIDVDDYFIDAAKEFSKNRSDKSIKYDFRKGFGELLPFEDNSFDAIISWDTFEHIASVKKTLRECKRVVRPGGVIYTVFPSYYTPGEAHLSLVSRTPLLQWFFNSESLNKAYKEILISRGSDALWYTGRNEEWQKLGGGIGINGTTFSDYIESVHEVNFSEVAVLPTPLFSIGAASRKQPKLKLISKVLSPFVRMNIFRDFLSHRIVSILRV